MHPLMLPINRTRTTAVGGFSLIELMVVVAIFSVAAALLVPRFLRHRITTNQEGCHRNLRSVFEAEKIYFQTHNSYTSDLALLRWTPPPAAGPYQYRFLPNPETGFRFVCSGNIDKDPTIDEATIDETGRITQVSDDIQK